jgi:hypothetical protein
MSKTLLSCHLFNEDGEVPVELHSSHVNVHSFVFSYIHNLILLIKHRLGNMGSLDSIFVLKSLSPYDYIQDSCFLEQRSGQKVYLFKMLVKGDGCGVNLIKWMQLGGDLENSWLMFDHVKHVQGWTTMAYHVYDLVYCKVMSRSQVPRRLT